MPFFKKLFGKHEDISKLTVYSPLEGDLISLSEVDDVVFSEGLVGDGCAIFPKNQLVKSPIDGVVKLLFPTKHAIGIESAQGVEIMIHIGINTVDLNGEGFRSLVKEGQKVKQGDSLIEFDRALLQEKGFDITTMIIVTEMKDFIKIMKSSIEDFRASGVLYQLVKE